MIDLLQALAGLLLFAYVGFAVYVGVGWHRDKHWTDTPISWLGGPPLVGAVAGWYVFLFWSAATFPALVVWTIVRYEVTGYVDPSLLEDD